MYTPQHTILNITVELEAEQWAKLPGIYSRMPGWIGFDEQGIPCWFSKDWRNNSVKIITASLEPPGLVFEGQLETDEWNSWINLFKELASAALGFPVISTQE